MNFALPAVLVILGLIPGILGQRGYFSGKFPREIASVSPIAEFATYFLVALPIDAIAIWFLSDAQRKAAFEVILGLCATTADSAEVKHAVTALSNSWLPATCFYFLVCIAAFASGVILRRIVWTFRLDVVVPSLRMKSDYYYLLQGRVAGFPRRVLPYADVLAEHPDEGTRLYRGVISQFSFTADGEIKELVLTGALRGKGRGSDFTWKDIPSSQFVLLGKSIHSVNMRYFGVDREVTGKFRRLRRKLRKFMRSFILEEP